LIDNLYGIMSIVSFICIVGICGCIAIPHDIRDIKRIMNN